MTKHVPVPDIHGGGGGKGGGGGAAYVPHEDPDSLRSKQFAHLLELLCEGEIVGLVDGLRSIFFDETPLENADGTKNFQGVSVYTRRGLQNQAHIPDFPAVESEQGVGVEVIYNVPVVRTITDPDVDRARITLGFPVLTLQTAQGDLVGTTVQLRISLQSNGGGFVEQDVQRAWIPFNTVDNATEITTEPNSFGVGGIIHWSEISSPPSIFPTIDPIPFIEYRIEYKTQASGVWTVYDTKKVSADEIGEQPALGVRAFAPGAYGSNFAYGVRSPYWQRGEGQVETVYVGPLPRDTYMLRIVKVDGVGVLELTGGYALVLNPVITVAGKTTSRYQRAYTIALTGSPPWDIKVERLTADSTSAMLNNPTVWDSFTEIIDAKLSYPNSALIGLKVDASQFQGIPSRGYEVKGLKVKVPVNYDPNTHQYSGVWNGAFKIAWTDNPVWCFYDLLTNTRYGLGNYVGEPNKWALYEIAQYCDELVPNGTGGAERRFTCNLYLQTQEEAYKVIANFASIFRAMVFWMAGQVTASCDMPRDPCMLFTAANVIDGQFVYSGSSLKSRHTVALVSWNDPNEMYKLKVEYVEDHIGITQLGIVPTEVLAMGCTSRGQAHRLGKWLLYTERQETETVTFRTGLDASFVYPGMVVITQDQFRSGKRWGGRLAGSANYLKFNGTNQYGVIADNSALHFDATQSFCIECWVRVPIAETGTGWFLAKGNIGVTPAQGSGWGFFEFGNTDPTQFGFYLNDGVLARMPQVSGAIYPKGTWVHLVGVVDRKLQRSFLWHQGVKSSGGNISAYGEVDGKQFTTEIAHGNFAGGALYAMTDIHDLRIYNRLLTDEEIAQHVAQGFPTATEGLVAWWPCSEGNGLTAKDVGTYKLHATLTPTAPWGGGARLDNEVELEAGKTYTLSAVMPDGTVEDQNVTSPSGIQTVLETAAPFTQEIQPEAMWVLAAEDLVPEYWRVVTISEVEKGQFEITALSYLASKFDEVERDIILEEVPTTAIRVIPQAVTNLVCFESLFWEGPTLRVRMTPSWESSDGSLFVVAWRELEGNWVEAKDVTARTFDIDGVKESVTYEIKVVAVNSIGLRSQPTSTTYLVLGKKAPPQDVTGFSIFPATSKDRIAFTWNEVPDLDRAYYEVRKGETWAAAERVFTGRVQDASASPVLVGSHTYLCKAFDTSGNESLNAAVAQRTFLAPNSPILTFRFEGPNVRIFWGDCATDFAITEYQLRHGTSWDEGTPIISTPGLSGSWKVDWGGSRTIWVAAIDMAGNIGVASSIEVNPEAPAMPGDFKAVLLGPDFIFEWDTPASSLPIAFFEIRDGDVTWEAAEMELQGLANSWTHRAHWSGVNTYWVAAVDSAGVYGPAAQRQVVVTPPVAPDITVEVVDNNVLLKWSDSTMTLPIEAYELRKGDAFVTAEVIGLSHSRFATLFERVAGTYRYWVVGIDSAGNYGTEGSISATVTEPPDFILYDEYTFHPTWTGTKTNMKVEAGKLYGGVNLTETIQTHFTSRSWDQPQDQIDAGYPRWIQPTENSCSYVHDIDYGGTIPSTKITVNALWSNKWGSSTVSCTIEYKLNSGDSWTTVSGVWSAFATNFRYVRITLAFSGAAADDLVEITSCTVRLDVKLKTDSGVKTCASGDSGGTTVSFNVTFIDVDSIQVTPKGTTAIIPVVDFTDAPNPTTFKVLLFNTAGARVSGDVTWLVRGV